VSDGILYFVLLLYDAPGEERSESELDSTGLKKRPYVGSWEYVRLRDE
jgi:hypothetical protein